jgi:rhodanese-related sulfurtransferase
LAPQSSGAPQEVTPEDLLAEADRGGYRLIDLQELRALYEHDSGNLLLVDTRQEWEYRSGHIQGSALFPMEPTWWERYSKKGELGTLLGSDKDRSIVFY